MEIGYAICLIAAVGLLIAYSVMVKTKEFWLTMLHVFVSVVNLGYLLMSLANTVEFAVFGNGVAYLGSVFLSILCDGEGYGKDKKEEPLPEKEEAKV